MAHKKYTAASAVKMCFRCAPGAATIKLLALVARKGGKAVYASDAVTVKLTRRHYYLSGILTGRETAAERALF